MYWSFIAAEGSGTSNILTTYLTAVSADWKSKVGKGSQVSWPTGNGGKGSEGVTGQVRQSPGAIGYVDLTYALQNSLPVAAIKNQGGNYVTPSTASASAAIASFAADLAKDVRTPIVNPAANGDGCLPDHRTHLLHHPERWRRQSQAHRAQAVCAVCRRRWPGDRQFTQLRAAARRHQGAGRRNTEADDGCRSATPLGCFEGHEKRDACRRPFSLAVRADQSAEIKEHLKLHILTSVLRDHGEPLRRLANKW